MIDAPLFPLAYQIACQTGDDDRPQEYYDGFEAYRLGVSIGQTPKWGSTWDQAAWMVGWFDALQKDIAELKKIG